MIIPNINKDVNATAKDAILIACRFLAFPYGTKASKSKYKHKKSTAVTKWDSDRPTGNFKRAFDKLFPNHWSWGSKKYGYGQRTGCSCDDGAATVARFSGVAASFSHSLDTLLKKKEYKNFKIIKYTHKSQLQPGDIVAIKYKGSGGHVFIVYDKNKRCDAGLNHHYLRITAMPAKYSDFKKHVSYGYIYRPRNVLVSLNCGYLAKGMISPEVGKLQAIVGVTIDNIFGPITEQGVITYQKNHGLTPDGIAGPLTIAQMEKEG